MSLLHIIHCEMDGSLDARRVQLQIRARTQIDDHEVFASGLLLTQFGGGNAGHLQFTKQLPAPPVFETDVDRDQCKQQAESASAQIGNRLGNLLNLIPEEKAEADETAAVQQRRKSVHEEKAWSADSRHPRQWRNHDAQTGNEFRDNDAWHSIARE